MGVGLRADYVNYLLLTADLQRVVGYMVCPQRPSIQRAHVIAAQNVTDDVVHCTS